ASADVAADRAAAAGVCARLAASLIELAPVSPDAPNAPGFQPVYRRKVPAPLVNVNVPPGAAWPLVGTRLGLRLYEDIVEFRHDPRGREYLWIDGGGGYYAELAGSDMEAYVRGAVSVTSLLLD